ncbi:MAG: AAA family ATPase, partial [Caldilineaceae bacterium]
NHMCICAIQQLIEIYQHNQRHEEAVACARRWVELDPLQEEAYYLLLKLLAHNGKRSEALAQFEQCRLVLKEELGVEPSAKLQKLYTEIRSGTNVMASRIQTNLPVIIPQKDLQRDLFLISPESYKALPVQRSTVPLLARDDELKRLAASLNHALHGSGQVVFVTGEAGRGKTALLNAFACEAQERHESLIVVGGSCNAYKGACELYHPFSEILALLAGDGEEIGNGEAPFACQSHRLNELFPSTVQALIHVGASLLDSLVPTAPLLKRIAKLPGGSEWQRQLFVLLGEQGKTARSTAHDHDALVNGLSKVFERLAQIHPMLILLDNFQWADAGSLNVLLHLGRRIKSLPILLVVAYRPSEIVVHPAAKEPLPLPLAMIVDEFKRQLGNVEVKLSREGDRPFVDAFLNLHPNRFDSKFCEALDWKTGGNPLFVIELIRDMQERGELTQDTQGLWTAKAALDWNRLPQRVDAVIRERLNHLPKELRALLEVASVEGEIFTAEVLAHALSIDVREVIHQLSGALTHQHRLVRAEGVHHIKQEQGKTFRLCRYRFRQPLFQHYLYQELDQVQRALLHEAVGTAIEAIYGPEEQGLLPVAAQLSNHFRTADLAEKAITYWFMACGRMLNMIIPNEVAQLEPIEQT